MFTFILSALGLIANPIANITKAIADEKIALLNAQTDQQRIQSQERIATLQAQRDVLVNDTPLAKFFDACVRMGFALPFLIYNGKLVLYDKVLMGGHTSTDTLSSNLLEIEMIVVGFYFLHSIGSLFKR